MKTYNIIGFAEQYYTLWVCNEHDIECVNKFGKILYRTAVRLEYVRNISKDINEVMKQFPNTVIDVTLKGEKRQSYMKEDKNPNLFNFGKYADCEINDVINSDFDYCLWAVNAETSAAETIKKHPKYQAYIAEQKRILEANKTANPWLKAGDKVTIKFLTNGLYSFPSFNGIRHDNDELTPEQIKQIDYIGHTSKCTSKGYDACIAYAELIIGGYKVLLRVECPGVKQVLGMYPYLMPKVNGKLQRTKGKSIEVEVEWTGNVATDEDIYVYGAGNFKNVQTIRIK